MRRNNRTLKRDAKISMQGNFGTQLLTGMVKNIIITVSGCVPLAPIVLAGPLSVGHAEIFTRSTDKEKPEFKDLFNGFISDFGETFLMGLLKSIFIFLWSLLFFIPGIVKCYSYSMSEYLMVRDRELTGSDAIKLSRELMKGNKMRLFMLDLSFLGWILLGLLTCGLVFLYVGPYMSTARTEFFNDIYYA